MNFCSDASSLELLSGRSSPDVGNVADITDTANNQVMITYIHEDDQVRINRYDSCVNKIVFTALTMCLILIYIYGSSCLCLLPYFV